MVCLDLRACLLPPRFSLHINSPTGKFKQTRASLLCGLFWNFQRKICTRLVLDICLVSLCIALFFLLCLPFEFILDNLDSFFLSVQICQGGSENWVEDPTNQSPLYARNRIRMVLNNLSSCKL